jgi:hypothetical protein
MKAAEINGPTTKKCRGRRKGSLGKTALEIREAVEHLTDRYERMTVRQVFYQLEMMGVVEKTEGGYRQVQRQGTRRTAVARDGMEGAVMSALNPMRLEDDQLAQLADMIAERLASRGGEMIDANSPSVSVAAESGYTTMRPNWALSGSVPVRSTFCPSGGARDR